MSEYAFASQNQSLHMQNLLLNDSEVGNTNRAPKLLSLDDYVHWKPRFEIYINGVDPKLWMAIKVGYTRPRGEGGAIVSLESLTEEQRKEYSDEKKAYAQLTQAIPRDIFHQFKKYKTSKTLWDALEKRNEGNASLKLMKAKALRKAFENFASMRNESLHELIERYYHLLSEMHAHDIVTTDEEIVQCLAEALPDKWTSFIMVLKNSDGLVDMDINDFVTRLKEQELENENRVKRSNQVQDPSLYYSGTSTSTPTHAPLQTAFVSNSQSQAPSPSQSNFGCHTSSSSFQNSKPSGSENCSATLRTENFSKVSVDIAKEDMALFSMVINSYNDLLAGRIGNNNLTAEDYEQIDRDEMERIDIMWCMANTVRRAKEYVRRTGKDLSGNKDTKYGFDMSAINCYNCGDLGHFARQCEKPKRSGNQNPFNKSQSNRRDTGTSKSMELVPVGNRYSESSSSKESGSKAMAVVHGDEGYDWSVRFSDVDRAANVARIADINEESASESENSFETETVSSEDESSVNEEATEMVDGERVERVDGATEETTGGELKDEAEGLDSKKAFAFMADTSPRIQVCTETPSVCPKCAIISTACKRCIELEDTLESLKLTSVGMSKELQANRVVKGNEKLLKEKNQSLTRQVSELKICVFNKQEAINFYIDTIDGLKREHASLKVDYETLDQKLKSYNNASYLLDYMLKPRSGNKNEGIGYNNVPPPVLNQLINTPKDDSVIEVTPVVNSNVNDKGKGVMKSESSEFVEGVVEDWVSDSESDTPGLGSKPVVILKSQASTSRPKPEVKPTFKPKIFVRAGELKKETKESPPRFKNFQNSPPRCQNVQTGSNVRIMNRRVNSSPRCVDRRTCFECGASGHLMYNCPSYLHTPHRKADLNQTFYKNRSASPVKSRMNSGNVNSRPRWNEVFTPTAKVSKPKIVKQTSVYFKTLLHKAQAWKSKVGGSGAKNLANVFDAAATPLGSTGKWMDLKVICEDGTPNAIRAWVPILN